MFAVSFEIRGHVELSAALRKAAIKMPRTIDRGIGAFAQETRAFIKSYPYPPQRHYPAQFTDRSRRYFFWALRNGVISVPYRRTGRLANSNAAQHLGLMVWALTNSAEYAGLVIGPKQATQHAGWWWKHEQVALTRLYRLNYHVE